MNETNSKKSCNYKNLLNKSAFFCYQSLKSVTFAGFQQNNMCICATSLSKTRSFKIVSREKSLNIADIIAYVNSQYQNEIMLTKTIIKNFLFSATSHKKENFFVYLNTLQLSFFHFKHNIWS